MKKIFVFLFCVVLLLSGASLYLYFSPLIPQKMAIHWNFLGQADGFGPKGIGLFLFPLLILVFSFILLWLPTIDPKKENIKLFEPAYHRFIAAFILFLVFVYFLVIIWNLGWQFSFNQSLSAGLAWFFYEISKLIGQAKMNYTIGIRTPWTLYSEESWNQTHQVVSKWTIVITLFILLGVLFPQYFIYIIGFCLVFFIVLSFGVSYWVAKKMKDSSEKR